MNRSKKSLLSLTSLLNTVRLPIGARVRAILPPQYRHKTARSVAMLAVAGAMAGAIGLASVSVKAGQAESAERAEMARAQAELDAAIEAKSRAQTAQSSAREASPNAQKSGRSEEAAALRRKLDILEQLLIRNQEENAQLRTKLNALMAQQKNAAAINGGVGRENAAKNKMLEREAQLRAAATAKAAQETSLAQEKAAEAMVNDLKQQLLLLQKQLRQADALYRNGHTTPQEITRLTADLEAARAQLEAAQAQMRAAQAGQKLSQKEQNVAQLHLEIAEQQARLQQAQANLAQVKARYNAGAAGTAEVQEAEANLRSIEVTIDQLKLKLTQEGGN